MRLGSHYKILAKSHKVVRYQRSVSANWKPASNDSAQSRLSSFTNLSGSVPYHTNFLLIFSMFPSPLSVMPIYFSPCLKNSCEPWNYVPLDSMDTPWNRSPFCDQSPSLFDLSTFISSTQVFVSGPFEGNALRRQVRICYDAPLWHSFPYSSAINFFSISVSGVPAQEAGNPWSSQ